MDNEPVIPTAPRALSNTESEAIAARQISEAAQAVATGDAYAVREYTTHRTKPAIHFDPPLHLTRGMEIGRDYSVTLTVAAAEDISWRIYGPPGNVHAGAPVVQKGSARNFTFRPVVAGRHLLVVQMWVATSRVRRPELSAFTQKIEAAFVATPAGNRDAAAAALWPLRKVRTVADANSAEQSSGTPHRGAVAFFLALIAVAIVALVGAAVVFAVRGRLYPSSHAVAQEQLMRAGLSQLAAARLAPI
jgi:hypothetical protein